MIKRVEQAIPNLRLRAARKAQGWTQSEVAQRIGAPSALNVTRWEQGKVYPSSFYLKKLCQLFNKKPEELGLIQEEYSISEHVQEAGNPQSSTLFWTVPYRRNPFFTGREGLLDLLHTRLMSEQPAELTRSYALSGLGGIGKTQLVLEYAHRFRQQYHAVFWVRAGSRETLTADFCALAHVLLLPQRHFKEQDLIVEAVKGWLTAHKKWLLILDNADDLSTVVEFLPAGGQGHFLLTTRAAATGTLAPCISVEQMNKDEAMLFLLRCSKILDADAPLTALEPEILAQAQAIVGILDGLPLALGQAGAYIEECGCSLEEYLELYQLSRGTLLDRRSSIPSDYPHTVVSVWSLSFSRIEEISPAAAELLRLLAFLDPDAIPEAMLAQGAAALGPILMPVASDTLQLREALEVIRRFSLVRRNIQAHTLSIHRLVQTVLKDQMDEHKRQYWALRIVQMLVLAFPEPIFTRWAQCQKYLSHALACAELIETYHIRSPEAGQVLNKLGSYLLQRGYYGQAQILLPRALAIREEVLGVRHSDTAATLDHLATLFISQSQYERAEPLLHRAQAIYQHTVGEEHPDMARTLNHLAILYHHQGHYQQAEPLYQQALKISQRISDELDPERADMLSNLALIYASQGNYLQAKPLYQQSLAIYQQIFGSQHPDVAIILYNLASLFYAQGHYSQAELLYQQALAISEQVWGIRHASSAMILNAQALLSYVQGKYDQAERLYEQALTIYESALGLEHPRVATLLRNLALLRSAQGDNEQAKSLYDQAIRIHEQMSGPEHPHLAMTFNDLVLLYIRQGHYEEAERLQHRALAICANKMGAEHPEMAKGLSNLARIAQAQGQEEQAEELYQRALTIYDHTLESRHPDVAACLKGLAILYCNQGQEERAELLCQQALHLYEEMLGDEHPDTISTREDCFASWSGKRPGQVHTSEGLLANTALDSAASHQLTASSIPMLTSSDGLTPRESEVLRLVAYGMTNSEISQELTITSHTVATHIRSIYNKLNISTRSAATRYAFEHKLL